MEGEGFAPGGDGDGRTQRIERGAVQIAAGVDKFAVALDPGTAIGHFDFAVAPVCGVKDVEVSPGVIDDALTVAGRIAGVVVRVIRVAGQVAAVGSSAVEVADALVIADKVDAPQGLAVDNPHRGSDIPGHIRQKGLKVAVPVAVQPEMAGRTTPVAFPAGGVASIAPQHHPPIRPKVQRAGRAVGQLFHRAVGRVRSHLINFIFAPVGLAVGGCKEDVAGAGIPTPAKYPAIAAQIGQTSGFAPLGRHGVDFRAAFLPPDKGQGCAVGRIERIGDAAQVGGQTSGHTATDRDLPEVVLGDKGDAVFVNSWKTIIADSHATPLCDQKVELLAEVQLLLCER